MTTPASAHSVVRDRRRRRERRLRELGYRSYNEYLASPHWLQAKARYRASELPQRCMCGEEDVQLHHTTYERIGEEQLTDFLPLCRRCHAAIHVLERRGDIDLDLVGLQSAQRAALYRMQRAPAIARAEQESDKERPLWQQLRELEPKATPRQLVSIRSRIRALRRATLEQRQPWK